MFLEQIGMLFLQETAGAGSHEILLVAAPPTPEPGQCWEELDDERRPPRPAASLASTSKQHQVDFNRWHRRALLTSRSPNKW